MSVQQTRPYPGYNFGSEAETPRPAARVKPEAEEYANRAKGSINLFTETPRYIDESKPEPRCPTGSARQNYEHGRHGTVNTLLDGQASPRPDVGAVPRTKSRAQHIAESHKGKSSASLINYYGYLPTYDPGVPRVKLEAQSTAEQHKGGRINSLMHDPIKLPLSARPVP
ncbi:hypothetical protein DPMN_155142 [Dreissena polymorpha]|uniref:Uncharacterized protein n=1 Tax=Dreissena polymorpha TaxID=45954 RepID=A0A9D4FMG2_DREPO|nr:hypothetical protein DPMN_155142 [Dreissena polymorpha]